MLVLITFLNYIYKNHECFAECVTYSISKFDYANHDPWLMKRIDLINYLEQNKIFETGNE
jgi:hypothetical protein